MSSATIGLTARDLAPRLHRRSGSEHAIALTTPHSSVHVTVFLTPVELDEFIGHLLAIAETLEAPDDHVA